MNGLLLIFNFTSCHKEAWEEKTFYIIQYVDKALPSPMAITPCSLVYLNLTGM